MYKIEMRSPPAMDLFEAARVGNCAELARLLEGGADANAYDRWDTFPLYYACRNGHYNAARMLLDAGAVHAENTFEGERCYRSALNEDIRRLLLAYEGRPPPSPPPLARLPTALLSAFLACNRAGAEPAPTDAAGAAPPDITLYVQGRPIEAHRVILAARSPYFRAKLTTGRRKMTLPSSHSRSFEAMYSLVRFFYTDRLEVSAGTMQPLARVCRACGGEGLLEMADRLDARKWLYRDSETRQPDPWTRFVLQAQPAQHRLPSALRRILKGCLANSRQDDLHSNSHYDDFADIRIKVGDRVFRCHQMILGLRSKYFRTRLLSAQTDSLEGHDSFQLEEHDVSAEAFEKMLEYVYTDEVEHLGDDPLLLAEELLNVASRYLLLGLKPVVADLLLPHLDLDHVSPAQLCRWLTLSDMHDVAKVRKHCLDIIACNFEAFSETKEFRALLLASRRSAAAADGRGDLLHDLRERWLRAAAAGLDKSAAALFDQLLEMIVLAARQEADDEQRRSSSVRGGSCASLYRQIASRLREVFCCILPPEEEPNDKSGQWN